MVQTQFVPSRAVLGLPWLLSFQLQEPNCSKIPAMEPTSIYCPYDIEAFSRIKSEELRTLCFPVRLRDFTIQVVIKEEASRDCLCPYLMWPMIANTLGPYCTFQDDPSCSCPSTCASWCLYPHSLPILHPFFYSPFSRAHFHCLSSLNPFLNIHSNSYSPSTLFPTLYGALVLQR